MIDSLVDKLLAELAQVDNLLVCVDFDGTICELGPDAYAVHPHPGAIAALEELAGLPGTSVAVLSGRHLDGLRQVCPLREPVILVGSHGAEPTQGGPTLTAEEHAELDRIGAELERIAVAPAFVEVKPYQRVLHVAKVEDTTLKAAMLQEALALTSRLPPMPGHNVVEFSAVTTTKGTWLSAEKTRFDATLFAGDDVTDETALAVLDPARGDVGIKIGAATGTVTADTCAQHRLSSVEEMAQFLLRLAAARRSAQG